MILSAIFVARSSSIKLPNFSVITAKKNLLTYVKPLARGASCSKEEKQRVECLVDDLMIAIDASNMNRDFATSPIVSGKWRLEYTTEAELLSLMGNPETVVTQSINMNNRGFLQNYVGFAGGWCDGWELGSCVGVFVLSHRCRSSADKLACADAGSTPTASALPATNAELLQLVLTTTSQILGTGPPAESDDLVEVGMDSLSAVEFRNSLSAALGGTRLPASLLFEHPSPAALASFLVDHLAAHPPPALQARRDLGRRVHHPLPAAALAPDGALLVPAPVAARQRAARRVEE